MRNPHEDATRYSNSITVVHYGQADRLKINRKLFRKEMKNSVEYGLLICSQEILSRHIDSPYGDVEEVMGDLHEILANSFECIRKAFNLKSSSLDVEKVLSVYERQKNGKNENM